MAVGCPWLGLCFSHVLYLDDMGEENDMIQEIQKDCSFSLAYNYGYG